MLIIRYKKLCNRFRLFLKETGYVANAGLIKPAPFATHTGIEMADATPGVMVCTPCRTCVIIAATVMSPIR